LFTVVTLSELGSSTGFSCNKEEWDPIPIFLLDSLQWN